MRLTLAVISLALAPAAAAQTLVVQARDTATSSRVTLAISEGAYALEQVGPRQYDLTLPGREVDFDTQQIFPGGRASRVVSTRTVSDPAGARLRLSLNCNCTAVQQMSAGSLTIEFREPVAEVSNAPSLPLELLAAAPVPLPEVLPLPIEEPPAPPPEIGPLPTRAPFPQIKPDPAALEPVEAEPAPALPEPDREEIALAQQRLLEQLSRAAEQGLLEFREPDPAPEPDPVVADTFEEAVPVEAAEIDPVPEEDAPVEIPVRAHTAIDRDFRPGRDDTIGPNGVRCIADARFDLRKWRGEGDFFDLAAEFNLTMVDGMDQPNPVSATGLTRLYLAEGLGAEARQLIEVYGEDVRDAQLLRDMSFILEGLAPPADGPITETGPCSGPAAMWYLAAGLQGRTGLRPQNWPTPLFDAYAALPVQMRRALAPQLITGALVEGDLELASKIDLLLRRGAGATGDAYDLAKARLTAAEGRRDEAIAELADLSRRPVPEAAEALLDLATIVTASEEAATPPNLADDIALAAHLYRQSPIGQRLTLAALTLRAEDHGMPPVLRYISDGLETGRGDPAANREAGHMLLESASAETTGSLAYAEAVLAYRRHISPGPTGDAARVKVARELTGVGLANAAAEILEPALARAAPGSDLAAAAVDLALDRPQAVLDRLEGVPGEEAAKLRALASEQLGQPDAALAENAPLTPEQEADLAWQAGDWARASAAGPEARRLLAAYMAGRETDALPPGLTFEPGSPEAAILNPPPVPTEPSLAGSVAAMETSQAVRDLLNRALTDG